MAEAEELEGFRTGGAPPASKTAVRALVKEILTEERLKQLGGPDVQCSVCRSVDHWPCCHILLSTVVIRVVHARHNLTRRTGAKSSNGSCSDVHLVLRSTSTPNCLCF